MHSTTVLACHKSKNESQEDAFWPCRCYGACESCIIFGDPELRPSIGISGLQGPSQIREKREKERNELRDLVRNYHLVKQYAIHVVNIYIYIYIYFSIIIGRKESPCTESNRGCGPWHVQRYCSSKGLRAGLNYFLLIGSICIITCILLILKLACPGCQLQRWACPILSDGMHNSGFSWWVSFADSWDTFRCLSPTAGGYDDWDWDIWFLIYLKLKLYIYKENQDHTQNAHPCWDCRRLHMYILLLYLCGFSPIFNTMFQSLAACLPSTFFTPTMSH